MASHAAHTTHDTPPRSAPRRSGPSRTDASRPTPGRTATRPDPKTESADSSRTQAWLATLAACFITGIGLWQALSGPLSSSGPAVAPQPFLHANGLVAAGPVTTFTVVLSPPAPGATFHEPTARVIRPLKALALQLVVPRAQGRYEVKVESAGSHFDYGDLSPRTLHGVSYVEVSIPRANLSAGTWQVRLLAGASGASGLLDRYRLRVVLR